MNQRYLLTCKTHSDVFAVQEGMFACCRNKQVKVQKSLMELFLLKNKH